MALYSWCRLLFLEQKMQFTFGKYNKYRHLCVDRRAETAVDKLRIADEVWNGPGVNSLEAQAHELYLRKVKKTNTPIGISKETRKITSSIILWLWHSDPPTPMQSDGTSDGIRHEPVK